MVEIVETKRYGGTCQSRDITYHDTDEIELTELVISPASGQVVPLFPFRIEQDLNGVVRRRIRGIDTTSEELQERKEGPTVKFSVHC